MRKSITGRTCRIGGSVAATCLTIGLLGTGLGTATAAALPNGYKKVVSIDGLVAETWRVGESASPAPSVANNGAGRSAVASGTFTARLSKGAGNVELGYLVGCQVNIDGLQGGLSGALDFIGATAGTSASISIPLTPGQVAYVKVTDKDIDKRIATIQTDRVDIDVQKCGGYASARSIVKLVAAEGFNTEGGTVNGEGGYVQSALFGKPFSLN